MMSELLDQYVALRAFPNPVTMAGEPENMPLINQVLPGLWIGGCCVEARLPDDFSHVVSLTELRYQLRPGVTVMSAVFQDNPSFVPDVRELASLANEWHSSLAPGENLLVHCEGGRNRSGLVVATMLVQQGFSPNDAIALLRAKRSPMVLFNQAFEACVLQMAVVP